MQQDGEIDVKELRRLADSINVSVSNYESAQDVQEKQHALLSLSTSLNALKTASMTPTNAFLDFTLSPLANACVRIAISLGIFEHLDQTHGSTTQDLAHASSTEHSLISRVVRGLVTFGILVHDDLPTGTRIRHTPLSQIYADPVQRAWAVWIWDVMLRSATSGLTAYFDNPTGPHTNPRDPRRAPFALAYDGQGEETFAIIQRIGKWSLLGQAMAGSSAACAKEAVGLFDFGALRPEEDGGVVLVDVGGGKGTAIQEIQRAHPGMAGRVVLQDLASVLEGVVPGLDAEVMAYDFFRETQPVKRAAAYLYQRILHDWSDENCRLILESLKPAMGFESKLIICDVVINKTNPPPRKILRDMNMLLVGGMERGEQEWEALLESCGFAVVAYHGLGSEDNSIIEARLAE